MRRTFLSLCMLGVAACSPRGSDPLVWSARAPLPSGPRQEVGVATLEERVWVMGGLDANGAPLKTVEIYDPASDSWAGGPELPDALHHLNAAAVNGKIFVVGALAADFKATGAVYAFDPATQAWTQASTLPLGTERGAAAVGVRGSKILIAGGFRTRSVADVSAYDVSTGTWEILPPLSQARDHLAGGVINGVFYAAAGREDGAITGKLEALAEGASTWSELPPVPTPRGGCAGAVWNGALVILGGEGNAADPQGVFSQTEMFHPDSSSWESSPTMLTPRHGIGAAVVGNALYVPAGATRQGVGAVSTNEVLSVQE